MPYNLKGRNVLVTGGSRGLGAVICRKFAAEGSNVAINYANNADAAHALAGELEKAHGVRTLVIQGDCGNVEVVARCVAETREKLGGLDVVIGNAGWTKFSEFGDLDALSYEEWDRCWAVNVKGMHALLKAALPTFKENAEGGVFIVTSSVAAQTLAGSSMAYSVTKAAQAHLVKCLANTQGPKVRINAVLPGLLLTEWGNLYGEEKLAFIKNAAALKKETELGDCADAYVMIAKNTSLTGQNIQIHSVIEMAATT